MERKYALTRVRSGDYIFPSNDGERLLRVSRYTEDGSTQVSADGKTWRKLTGTYWGAYWFGGTMDAAQKLLDSDELLEYDRWREIEYMLPTRAAAIDAALKYLAEVAAMRES